MAPADWTERDREIIDTRYRFWKISNKVSSRRNVVTSTALRCGDLTGDPDTWFAKRWELQIGRYASRHGVLSPHTRSI